MSGRDGCVDDAVANSGMSGRRTDTNCSSCSSRSGTPDKNRNASPSSGGRVMRRSVSATWSLRYWSIVHSSVARTVSRSYTASGGDVGAANASPKTARIDTLVVTPDLNDTSKSSSRAVSITSRRRSSASTMPMSPTRYHSDWRHGRSTAVGSSLGGALMEATSAPSSSARSVPCSTSRLCRLSKKHSRSTPLRLVVTAACSSAVARNASAMAWLLRSSSSSSAFSISTSANGSTSSRPSSSSRPSCLWRSDGTLTARSLPAAAASTRRICVRWTATALGASRHVVGQTVLSFIAGRLWRLSSATAAAVEAALDAPAPPVDDEGAPVSVFSSGRASERTMTDSRSIRNNDARLSAGWYAFDSKTSRASVRVGPSASTSSSRRSFLALISVESTSMKKSRWRRYTCR
eukprot:Unigene15200_Nuclearia_a/m.45472 Unigene15200_Nuclearia_a/g.45472  ORF Unigene15200_Nuclearia_a/g.45472 Unigene15200_Nuclearia_a/m.45472 type:complete len:406 (+) Unigene15200_Nuclearia_a:571-1788(+)